MKNNNILNSTIEGLLELLSLLVVLLLVLVTIHFSAVYDYTTSESSLIELSQAVIIFISSILALYQSKGNYKYKKVIFLLGLLFLVMFIREMDYPIEMFFPHGSWKYPVWLIIFVGLVFFWRSFDEVVSQFQSFSQEKEYSVLIIGLLIVLVFSRFAGIKEFWSVTLDIEDSRNIKTLVEEGLELLGYSLIMTSLFFRKLVINN